MIQDDFTINRERAEEVVTTSVSMLHDKVYPFDRENLLPDAIMPPGIAQGSLEHSLFLFYACSIDSMRLAQEVYRTMREIAGEIDLKKLPELDELAINNLIEKRLGTPGQMGQLVDTLYENSRTLNEIYDGDPRKIKQSTIEETLSRLQQFRQFGPGKSALLMKNFVRFGFWDLLPHEIPIKVDRHVVRISIGNDVLRFSEGLREIRADKFVKPLMQVYREVTSEQGVSAVELDDALWVLGPYLCRKNAKSFCDSACYLDCKIRPKLTREAVFLLNEEMRSENSQLFLRL